MVLEALASGVPVVASRVGGVPDILKDGYNGLIVEPRNVEALADAIIRILTDGGLKKRLTEAGLRTMQNIRENEIENLLMKLMFE